MLEQAAGDAVLLECVPNVSEGRRPEVIERLVAASQIDGCRLADVHRDPDHNRSVLTWFGRPGCLVEAAVALARAAMVEIDLTRHRGVHPRVGAVDVLPLVAVGSAPIELAIETARVAGRLLAAELELPVLLYGEAASRSKRRPLAAHRRGGLAALTVRMERGEWPPDFGPKRPHPTAGVVLVGARRPLVAFNVVLDSDDVLVAKSVAAALREGGSAGMLGLRALGLVLESRGKVQVSMNLTAPDKTPLASVVAAVEREAARWGVSVLESELVGLTPAAAVAGADAARLKLPGLEPRQIVESYLDGVVAG